MVQVKNGSYLVQVKKGSYLVQVKKGSYLVQVGFPAPPSAEECARRLHDWGGVFESAARAPWGGRFVHVEDPPWWLFREGDIDHVPAVAIVGTRRCTEYGRRIASAMGAASRPAI